MFKCTWNVTQMERGRKGANARKCESCGCRSVSHKLAHLEYDNINPTRIICFPLVSFRFTTLRIVFGFDENAQNSHWCTLEASNERWHHYNFHWWQETTPNLSDSYHLPFFSLAHFQWGHNISRLWRKRRRHPWTMSLKQEGESGTRRSSTEHCKLHHVNCVHSRLWEKFLSCWCLTSSTKPVNTHLFAKKCLHLATHCERERDQLECTMQTERKRGGTKLT